MSPRLCSGIWVWAPLGEIHAGDLGRVSESPTCSHLNVYKCQSLLSGSSQAGGDNNPPGKQWVMEELLGGGEVKDRLLTLRGQQ